VVRAGARSPPSPVAAASVFSPPHCGTCLLPARAQRRSGQGGEGAGATAGSPKALARRTCERPRACLRSCHEAAPRGCSRFERESIGMAGGQVDAGMRLTTILPAMALAAAIETTRLQMKVGQIVAATTPPCYASGMQWAVTREAGMYRSADPVPFQRVSLGEYGESDDGWGHASLRPGTAAARPPGAPGSGRRTVVHSRARRGPLGGTQFLGRVVAQLCWSALPFSRSGTGAMLRRCRGRGRRARRGTW
jgi:hypothetical protein